MATSRRKIHLWAGEAVAVVLVLMFTACAPRLRPAAVGVEGMPLTATTDPAVIAHSR